MSIIHIQDHSKRYKILDQHEGLAGAVRDPFSNDYRLVKAVDGSSLDIGPGEILGYIDPNEVVKSITIKLFYSTSERFDIQATSQLLIGSALLVYTSIQISLIGLLSSWFYRLSPCSARRSS